MAFSAGAEGAAMTTIASIILEGRKVVPKPGATVTIFRWISTFDDLVAHDARWSGQLTIGKMGSGPWVVALNLIPQRRLRGALWAPVRFPWCVAAPTLWASTTTL